MQGRPAFPYLTFSCLQSGLVGISLQYLLREYEPVNKYLSFRATL